MGVYRPLGVVEIDSWLENWAAHWILLRNNATWNSSKLKYMDRFNFQENNQNSNGPKSNCLTFLGITYFCAFLFRNL
jgi:hypothetical protein